VHGTSMIPQTHLSEDERWAVIQYIKRFSPRFVRENPSEPIRLPPPPADLRAKREQGARRLRLPHLALPRSSSFRLSLLKCRKRWQPCAKRSKEAQTSLQRSGR
jgi:hypothetical protein